MQLLVNGESKDVQIRTLAELIQSLGHSGNFFAVAVDGEHVPNSFWSDTQLREHQSIEILQPMSGG